jgi:hypothetical protein
MNTSMVLLMSVWLSSTLLERDERDQCFKVWEICRVVFVEEFLNRTRVWYWRYARVWGTSWAIQPQHTFCLIVLNFIFNDRFRNPLKRFF